MHAPAFQRLIDDGELDVERLARRGIDVQACYESLIEEVRERIPPRLADDIAGFRSDHGLTRYAKHGCRCKVCMQAQRDYYQGYKNRSADLRRRVLEAQRDAPDAA